MSTEVSTDLCEKTIMEMIIRTTTCQIISRHLRFCIPWQYTWDTKTGCGEGWHRINTISWIKYLMWGFLFSDINHCMFNAFLLCPLHLWFNSAATPSLLIRFNWSPIFTNGYQYQYLFGFSRYPLLRMAHTNGAGRVSVANSHTWILSQTVKWQTLYFSLSVQKVVQQSKLRMVPLFLLAPPAVCLLKVTPDFSSCPKSVSSFVLLIKLEADWLLTLKPANLITVTKDSTCSS